MEMVGLRGLTSPLTSAICSISRGRYLLHVHHKGCSLKNTGKSDWLNNTRLTSVASHKDHPARRSLCRNILFTPSSKLHHCTTSIQLQHWHPQTGDMTAQEWHSVIENAIITRRPDIAHINKYIHENPELAYEEHKAHDAFVELLQSLGFEVTPHAYGVETAFSAEFGTGGRLLIFNAEYDALPGIGHACGHNLIASAGLTAFLGVAAALKQSKQPGRVRLLGTPAEEGGGGKLKLIAGGAYKGASACLMVHPGPGHLLSPPFKHVSYVRMLANVKMRVYFKGKEAHASIAPWDGVNALDAVCLSYNAISMLRQHIRPYERIHGVFRSAGDRPNVTPADCCVEYYVRSSTRAGAETLWQRVLKCFEGAALATGCEVRTEPLNSYADVRPSASLCRAYIEVMPKGTVSYGDPPDILAGSTDMGDVCYECPGFHGVFGINTSHGEANHTKGFTSVAGTEEAFDLALESGKGMALVGWKVLSDDAFAETTWKEWEEDMKLAAKGE